MTKEWIIFSSWSLFEVLFDPNKTNDHQVSDAFGMPSRFVMNNMLMQPSERGNFWLVESSVDDLLVLLIKTGFRLASESELAYIRLNHVESYISDVDNKLPKDKK